MKSILFTANAILGIALALSACSKILPSKGATATTPVYSLAISSGNNQSGSAGSELPLALVVQVTDITASQAARNIQVDWTITSGSGTFLNENTTSDANGAIPTNFILGSSLGTEVVTATLHSSNASSGGTASTAVTAVTFHLTSHVGSVSASASNIVGSGPVEPDGVSVSNISIAPMLPPMEHKPQP